MVCASYSAVAACRAHCCVVNAGTHLDVAASPFNYTCLLTCGSHSTMKRIRPAIIIPLIHSCTAIDSSQLPLSQILHASPKTAARTGDSTADASSAFKYTALFRGHGQAAPLHPCTPCRRHWQQLPPGCPAAEKAGGSTSGEHDPHSHVC